jgi:hypothetical protein
MIEKFIVRLLDEERGVCQEIIKKLKGSSQRFRRAQILLKADADGPGWSDVRPSLQLPRANDRECTQASGDRRL